MKKFNLKMKTCAAVLASGVVLTTITGCNQTVFDTEYTFNKAIIFGEGTATIIEIKKWNDYEGEQLQLITKDGMVIITSSYDTKLINDEDTNVDVEVLVRALAGSDAEITYYDELVKTKTK